MFVKLLGIFFEQRKGDRVVLVGQRLVISYEFFVHCLIDTLPSGVENCAGEILTWDYAVVARFIDWFLVESGGVVNVFIQIEGPGDKTDNRNVRTIAKAREGVSRWVTV